ncbi:hypothetical protein [Streptosporangium roseum]|uniref:hypothetical protein n=1 Tax=Streptosporangium roseum TaxID=2001 RepID=UPI003325B66F
MALYLQRAFSLLVVKAALTNRAGRPAVRLEFVVNEDGQQRVTAQRTDDLDRYGFGGSESSEPKDLDLHVPENVVFWIAALFQDMVRQREMIREEIQFEQARGMDWPDAQDERDVLWLHLVKPYGALGAVPWERFVQPEVGVPFLRLPDALPEPQRSISRFRVALCAAASSERELRSSRPSVSMVARALFDGVGTMLRLHVFAEQEDEAEMRAVLQDLPKSVLTIHPPPPPSEAEQKPHSAGNPWLLWIQREMAGRGLDAVHLIAHGCALGNEGGILTGSRPGMSGSQFPQVAQSRELRDFLTQTGALIVGFTRPDGNYSDYGLWRLVDELGSLRAGPVLLHDPRDLLHDLGDEERADDLAQSYKFLSATAPAHPPASPNLVLFAQPGQIADLDLSQTPEKVVAPLLPPSPAVKELFARGETPGWLSAAQRFIEQSEAELIRFKQSREQRDPSHSEAAFYEGKQAALEKIREVVDRHAEDQL